MLRPERRLVDPVRAESEPPFLRPQQRTRVGKGRRSPRGRAVLALNIGALLFFTTCGLWRGYSKVMASEHLKVTRVEVRGGHFLSEGEVRELLGPAVGENILTLDIDSLKQ